MKQKTVKAIALILVIALVITSFSFVFFMPSGLFGSTGAYVYGATDEEEQKHIDARLALLEIYIKYIQNNYKDKVDVDIMLDGAFKGAMEALGDPHSVYYTDVEDAESFSSAVENTFEGIGVQIQLNGAGKVEVVMPIAGSPAQKAGVATGDIITAVDGKSTEGLTLNEVSQMLRGPKGTKVKVTVVRSGKELNFDIVRDTINENCLEYTLTEENIGYIVMSGFDADASTEFIAAYEDLLTQGAVSFVLDLRNNGGGYIEEARIIADYLLEGCAISYYQIQDEIIETIMAADGRQASEEMVILVNENTASASEFLAAALQSQGSKVVGTVTFGKGIAQVMNTLMDGHQFKLSILYFLKPDKTLIQDIGIIPDYEVRYSAASEAQLADLQDEYSGFAPMTELIKPSKGMIGLNVYGAQQRLLMLGYDVEVSGFMDDKTVTAVRSFQGAEALYPYGVLDYTTMQHLDDAAYGYAHGITGEDLQYKKAIEILTK